MKDLKCAVSEMFKRSLGFLPAVVELMCMIRGLRCAVTEVFKENQDFRPVAVEVRRTMKGLRCAAIKSWNVKFNGK